MAQIGRSIINEDNVKPFRSPQQKRQRVIAVFVVLGVIGLAAAAYFLLVPKEESYRLADYQSVYVLRSDLVQSIQASGTVTIATELELPSPEAGQAAQLFVSEGDQVVTGQVLARIDVPDLQEDLYDLQADLDSATRSYQKNTQQNEVTINRKIRDIKAAEKDIAEQEEEVERVAALVKINAARQSELDAEQQKLDDLVDAKTEKEIQLEEDSRLQDLDEEIQRANIEGIQTKIDRLEARITDATIRSPMDGEVISIEKKLGVPGSKIGNAAALFTIVDPDSAVVELEVEEQYSSALQEGDSVELTISNRKLTGTIESVGRVAQMSSDGLSATIAVVVQPNIDPADPNADVLLQGATAVGVFELGMKAGALILPRGPYLTTGSQRYLYKIDGDTAIRIDVTFGDVQGNEIEVLSGVEEGDNIITSGYQNYIEYQNVRLEKGE